MLRNLSFKVFKIKFHWKDLLKLTYDLNSHFLYKVVSTVQQIKKRSDLLVKLCSPLFIGNR